MQPFERLAHSGVRGLDHSLHRSSQGPPTIADRLTATEPISALKIAASRCGACVRTAPAGEDRPPDRTDGAIKP